MTQQTSGFSNAPVFAPHGRRAYHGCGLVNTEENPFHLPQIRFWMSNEPVIKDGELQRVDVRETIYLFFEKDILKKDTDLSDPDLQEWIRMELYEYRLSLVTNLGDVDKAERYYDDVDKALESTYFKNVGDDVCTAARNGRLDLLVIRKDAPDTGALVEMGDQQVRVKRNLRQEINFYDFERAFRQTSLGSSQKMWLHKGGREHGQRFFALAGEPDGIGDDSGISRKALVFGKMPADDYRRTKKNGRLGERGRGWAVSFKANTIKQMRVSKRLEFMGAHFEFLKSHPTDPEIAELLKKRELTATLGELAGLAPGAKDVAA